MQSTICRNRISAPTAHWEKGPTPSLLPKAKNNCCHLTPPGFCHKNCLNHKILLLDILASFLMPKFQEYQHPLQCIALASELSPGYTSDLPDCAGWEDTGEPLEHHDAQAETAMPQGRQDTQAPTAAGTWGKPWRTVHWHQAVAAIGVMPAPPADHHPILTRLLQDCTHITHSHGVTKGETQRGQTWVPALQMLPEFPQNFLLHSAELLSNQKHLRKIPGGGRIQTRCSE